LHFPLTYSWQGLIITSFAVWILVEVMCRKKLLHPSYAFLVMFPILFDVIADIFKLYTNVPHFAKALHFTNSAIFAVILLSSVYLIRKKISGFDYWLTWTTVVAVGAMYDLEEFWESIFLHTNRYVGGAAELTDITADCFGAIFMILVIWLIMKLRKKRLPENN
jgi:hypothetical protein